MAGLLDLEEDQKIEYTLVQIRECFIYRVAATHSARGYVAGDWDLAKPFATAELIVKQKGDECYIRLYKQQQGGAMRQLLAECPLEFNKDPKHKAHHLNFFVEPCTDSSRYFVVRIKDRKTGRSASLGCGFRNREDAFSFRANLEDYFKQMKQANEPKKTLQPVKTAAKALGSGEKIKIKFNVKKKDKPKMNDNNAFSSMSLKMPSSSNNNNNNKPSNTNLTTSMNQLNVNEDDWGDDDDFGDFQG